MVEILKDNKIRLENGKEIDITLFDSGSVHIHFYQRRWEFIVHISVSDLMQVRDAINEILYAQAGCGD